MLVNQLIDSGVLKTSSPTCHSYMLFIETYQNSNIMLSGMFCDINSLNTT